MSPAPAKRPLPGFGHKGVMGKYGESVRAELTTRGGRPVVLVKWREQGQRRQESWPDTVSGRKEAKAFGEGVAARLAKLARGEPVGPTFVPRTVREVWDLYVLAEWDNKRKTTHKNYKGRWRQFEAFFGAHRPASELTREHLDVFRKELRKLGREVNQIGHIIDTVKRVWKWAIDRDLIPPSKVATYTFKIGKDEKRLEVPEYTREEATKILAQFDPRDAQRWRPWVATYLLAFAGPRQRAALHLEWRDVDFAARTVTWRAELDKTGRRRVQPLPDVVIAALRVAYGWRLAMGYTGPFVFFRPAKAVRQFSRGRLYVRQRRVATAKAAADTPWTYSAYNARLRDAERDAGVPHVKYRAAHGFRRLVLGDALDATGNLVEAGRYIGDTDVRVLAKSYVRDRPEQLRGVAELLNQRAPTPAPAPAPANIDRTDNETTTAAGDEPAAVEEVPE